MSRNWSEQDLADYNKRLLYQRHGIPVDAQLGRVGSDADAVRGDTALPAPATRDPPAPRRHPEDDLQIQVAEFLDLALPPPLRWLHIPNGGKRGKVVAAILKAMGVKKGAADVLILGWSPFIWIELKSEEGRLSEEQKDWRDWCRDIGAPWFCCRSLEDVITAIESLGITLLARAA